MDQNPSSSSSRADRKTIEKNRRNEMRALYSHLYSLLPHQSQREMVSLPDQLEGATNYIKMMQAKLQKMKHKKDYLSTSASKTSLPNIDVRVTAASALEVVLITGLDSQFMFNGIIRLLHEQGAEVVGASLSVHNNTVYHTIHAEIGDQCAQNYISVKLRKFVYDSI